MEDKIKDAFNKVKEEISSLKKDLENLKINFLEIKNSMIEICEIIKQKDEKTKELVPSQPILAATFETNFPAHDTVLKPLKDQNFSFSTRNEGVPTDRQTDNPTDRQSIFKQEKSENSFENVSQILDSLDNLKKEIRLKFKRITDQELLVFSTIYQLEEEIGYANYKLISEKLSLSQSSVRDYVGNLIKKGIPVDKQKIKNKNISLSISSNLKKIATLSTILKLREL